MSGAGGVRVSALPPQRRHTLFFLRATREFAPVFLDTEVDVSALRARPGRRISTVTHVLYAAARVLARHPEANAALRDGIVPRIAHHDGVHAKVTVDATVQGQRVVLAGVLRDLHVTALEQIQDQVEALRDADPDTDPRYGPLRALHAEASWKRAASRFRELVTPLENRAAVWGTVAVTSLSHRAVDAFHSVGGTTVTLGLGRVTDRAVVRDGAVVVAPVLRLNLAFDHRVIDGAEAADVLTEIKDALEEGPP